MFRAILFDLDGTLLDSLEDLRSAVNHVMKEHGFPVHSTLETKSFVGNGVGVLIDKACPAGTDEETVAACLREFKEWYFDHAMEQTIPYDGILPMLHACRRAGFMIGVVSNKFEAAVGELLSCTLPGAVDQYTGDLPGYPRKPNPANVFRCMELLGIHDPAEVIYVGDSETDIETARNAGMELITVTWGFRDRSILMACGARNLVDTPDKLWTMIRTLQDKSC